MGAYSFVKSVRRSQSDVSICHIRISGCVCYNSAQISLIRTPSKRKPVTHFLECVQRLQYLNQLFRNLCQRYEVRLWHIPFNQFHTVWINYAPFLRYFMQTKNCLWPKSCFARWELNLLHVPFLLIHLPCFLSVFFLRANMIVWLSFLRAMVLNRDPKVKSPRFETRSGKKTQRLPSCWGHPRESLEDEASLVLVRQPIEPPFVMSSVFSTPFSIARLSVNCSPFNLPMGVSARNHGTWRSPKKMMIFWVRGPAPFFNCSNFFSSRLIFCLSLSSSARVGESFFFLSPHWGVIVVSHHSHSLWDPIVLGSGAG